MILNYTLVGLIWTNQINSFALCNIPNGKNVESLFIRSNWSTLALKNVHAKIEYIIYKHVMMIIEEKSQTTLFSLFFLSSFSRFFLAFFFHFFWVFLFLFRSEVSEKEELITLRSSVLLVKLVSFTGLIFISWPSSFSFFFFFLFYPSSPLFFFLIFLQPNPT